MSEIKTQITPDEFPELVIGIAGPIGVNVDLLTETISACLKNLNYDSQLIKLTEEMERFGEAKVNPPSQDLHTIYNWKMDYANDVREKYKKADALARIAIQTIREYRKSFTGDVFKIRPSIAYIIRQLKLPEEVQLLRKVYGRQFILVSAYANENDRFDLLCNKLKEGLHTDTPDTEIGHKAADLIARDSKEDNESLGQNIRETFHLADVFTHGNDKAPMESSVGRFFEAFFGRNDITPSRDEYGMYSAKSAALRSCDLSRQVGAVLFTTSGEVITQGCNEVAKAFGGNYWDQEQPDFRDIQIGYDPNESLKKDILRNVIERLLSKSYLSEQLSNLGTSTKIVDHLIGKSEGTPGVLSDSGIMDLTEYGRVVHAEMNAICDAARTGRSVRGSILYCTTFPCHNCTKHILASGVERVVFLEPYPKSKAPELFKNEIEIESDIQVKRISFVPFMGISPFRYRDIFMKGRRKDNSGKATKWYYSKPKPMLELEFPSYVRTTELWAISPLIGSLTVE